MPLKFVPGKPSNATAVRRHRDRIVARSLAVQENRIKEYNAEWRALKSIRQERAADPETVALPGYSSGLIVQQFKSV